MEMLEVCHKDSWCDAKRHTAREQFRCEEVIHGAICKLVRIYLAEISWEINGAMKKRS